MGSRGGGLQGLLEHAAREYEKVDTEARGPEVGSAEETGAVALLTPRSNRPAAGSPAKSSGSADSEEQSAGRTASNRDDGSDSREAGTPSRKRQRVVDSGPRGVSPSPRRGLNSGHFSEDGASAGESYEGDAGAVAGKEDGAGTNRFGIVRFVSRRRVNKVVLVRLFVLQHQTRFGERGRRFPGVKEAEKACQEGRLNYVRCTLPS